MGRVFIIGALTAVLAACGNGAAGDASADAATAAEAAGDASADAETATEAADEASADAVAATETADEATTTPDDERTGPAIPEIYRGLWETTGGDCRVGNGSSITIEAHAIIFSSGTSDILEVTPLGPGVVELLTRSESSGDAEPLGFALGEEGDSLMMHGPGFSPIPYERCEAE